MEEQVALTLPGANTFTVRKCDGDKFGGLPGVELCVDTPKNASGSETRHPTPEEWRLVRDRVIRELDRLYGITP